MGRREVILVEEAASGATLEAAGANAPDALAPVRRRRARWWDSDLAYSFRRSPVAVVSAIVLTVCLCAAFFAPWLAPHNPFDLASLNLLDALSPPRGLPGGRPEYLLGTDDQGRDVLSAIMFGARVSLLVGLAAVVLAMLIGVNVGPNLTYVGSLATLLWRRIVHAHDQETDMAEFTRLGLLTVPASLLACTVALWLALQVV